MERPSSSSSASSTDGNPEGLRPHVACIPVSLVSSAHSVPSFTTDRLSFKFELCVSEWPGCPPLSDCVHEVRFQFHTSFGKRANETIRSPPFKVIRTCWAEHLVHVAIVFKGVREPAKLRHLVRLFDRAHDPHAPTAATLESPPPPPTSIPSARCDPVVTRSDNLIRLLVGADDAVWSYAARARAAHRVRVAGVARVPAATRETLRAPLEGLQDVEKTCLVLDRFLDALTQEHQTLTATVCRLDAELHLKLADAERRLGHERV
jgi:hypothetical protein